MVYIYLVLLFFALLFDKLNIIFFLLFSALMHECGHIAACMMCRTNPKIKLSVFGIRLYNYPVKRLQKFFVLLCGPSVNFLLIIVSFIKLNNHFTIDCYIFMCVNIVIFIFNLLPFEFMDGGQIIAVFSDNVRLKIILEIFSFIIIIFAITYISADLLHTSIAFLLFIIYYFINKNSLYL